MGVETGIGWTHHTWSPWRGCTKVSEGCTHCYAEKLSHRNPGVLGIWGDKGTRVAAGETAYKMLRSWNRKATKLGERHRVFPSLCDPFEDREDLVGPLASLLLAIHATSNLDYLLLTKRPELFLRRMQAVGRCVNGDAAALADQWRYGSPMPNIWGGVSTENQARANERIPHLLRIPLEIRFLSVEPLIGPVDPTKLDNGCGETYNALTAEVTTHRGHTFRSSDTSPINWVIVGGESGPGRRPCEIDWIRSIVDWCIAANVPVYVKQDAGPQPGMQGRIPDDLWSLKQFPVSPLVANSTH